MGGILTHLQQHPDNILDAQLRDDRLPEEPGTVPFEGAAIVMDKDLNELAALGLTL